MTPKEINEKVSDEELDNLSDINDSESAGNSSKGSKSSKFKAEHPGSTGKLIAGVLIVVLIIFGIAWWGLKKAPVNINKQTAQPTEQVKGNRATTKFKNDILPTTNAQENIQIFMKDWRAAVMEYSNTGDVDTFKQKLSGINTRRYASYKTIRDAKDPVSEVVRDSSSVVFQGLQKSFKANSQEEAYSAFNESNAEIKANNDTYKTKFTQLLNRHHIKYTIKDYGDKGYKINY